MQPLVDGPRSGLTESEVEQSLGFHGGASISWGVDVLDIETGDLVSHDLEFVSGYVSWDYRVANSVTGRQENEASVRRTGQLEVIGDLFDIAPFSKIFRLWITMASGGSPHVKWYLGSFVCPVPPMSYDGRLKQWTLDLADKTHYWAQREIGDNRTIPFNRHILLFIQEELGDKFGETEFDFPDIDRYTEDDLFIEAEDSYLDMFNVALEHKGFEPLTATPEGLAKTRDAEDFYQKDIEHVYSTDDESTVVEGAEFDPVLPNAPNVLKFVASRGPSLPVEGNGIYTIYNHNVGVASINERGYEVSKRIEVEADDQEHLEKIAKRDANRHFMGGGDRVNLRVGLNPRHDDRDVIGILYPEAGMHDDQVKWAVTSWEVNLPESIGSENDVTMGLTAEKLWVPPES